MEAIKRFFIGIKEFLDVPITKLGETEITLWIIVYFVFLLFLLAFVTGKLRKWIVFSLLAKSKVDLGTRVAVGSILRYIILVIGLVVALQTVGIDLSTFTIIAGALGIGIGFGLQNVANNLVSGIIILFERPVKVGDRVEIGDISGDVINIRMRSTTILTNDNIAIIVPNSEFISNTVINWSYNDRNVRFNFPVNVSYKEDPENVKQLLLEVARDNKGVLNEPKPDVLFDKFGDSALVFNLRVWTREYTNRPGVLRSQLYYAIAKKFRENKIEIPYPQRDIHIKPDGLPNIFSEK
ncbi:MAG: mechanosensitive ion channel [Ignavibacteriaceae bacterium]